LPSGLRLLPTSLAAIRRSSGRSSEAAIKRSGIESRLHRPPDHRPGWFANADSRAHRNLGAGESNEPSDQHRFLRSGSKGHQVSDAQRWPQI
jgi:hypothetical protein